jgi:hypothetical protein
VILTPAYSIKSLVLRPVAGRGALSFEDGSAMLKVTLTPFFQGEKGDKGDQGDSASISYTHFQNVPASIWVIEHNLGFWPNVYVLDTNGDECEGDVQNHPSMNRTDIFFSAPFAGRARLT